MLLWNGDDVRYSPIAIATVPMPMLIKSCSDARGKKYRVAIIAMARSILRKRLLYLAKIPPLRPCFVSEMCIRIEATVTRDTIALSAQLVAAYNGAIASGSSGIVKMYLVIAMYVTSASVKYKKVLVMSAYDR